MQHRESIACFGDWTKTMLHQNNIIPELMRLDTTSFFSYVYVT